MYRLGIGGIKIKINKLINSTDFFVRWSEISRFYGAKSFRSLQMYLLETW